MTYERKARVSLHDFRYILATPSTTQRPAGLFPLESSRRDTCLRSLTSQGRGTLSWCSASTWFGHLGIGCFLDPLICLHIRRFNLIQHVVSLHSKSIRKEHKKSLRFCSALREDGFLHRQGTHHGCCILDSLMGKLDHRNASPICKLQEKTCSHNVLNVAFSLSECKTASPFPHASDHQQI